MLYRLVVAWTLALAVAVGFLPEAWAVPLTIDGSLAGPATCPGGTAVDRNCTVSSNAAQNVGCRYGGEHTFDSITLTNNAFLCVTTYNGVDKENTGNVVLKSLSTIVIDATSRITAKGRGYQGLVCDDGPGPTAAAGGKGGCSVLDSGGGGAHFGAGGRGTKDCTIVAPGNSCQFPHEWEEDCGARVGNACVATPDPLHPVCYGSTNNPNGAGDANPSVAGQAFKHSIFDPEFGAAGGDKGCRDGDGFDPRLAPATAAAGSCSLLRMQRRQAPYRSPDESAPTATAAARAATTRQAAAQVARSSSSATSSTSRPRRG